VPPLDPFVSFQPSPEAIGEFGVFSLVLYADDEVATAHAAGSGQDGIGWVKRYPENQQRSLYWSAVTTYGALKLTWNTPVQQVDDRWIRLDGVLAEIAQVSLGR
jgi:hypothetical protein